MTRCTATITVSLDSSMAAPRAKESPMDSRTGPLIVAHAAARAPPVLEPVAPPPVRASFALEVLGFCVRAHMHRLRSFLL